MRINYYKMKSYKIEYTVKKSKIKSVIELVDKFIDGIRNNEPETIIYHSYQDTANTANFIHLMTFKNENAERLHRDSSYCQKFLEELVPYCEKTPEYIPMTLIR